MDLLPFLITIITIMVCCIFCCLIPKCIPKRNDTTYTEIITPLRGSTRAVYIQPPSSPGDVLTIDKNLSTECAICLEFFDAGENIRVLDCGHYYHQECIDPWFTIADNCPKCRGENMV